MYGLMSLTFCKRVCVMARSWDRAGHVSVLCGRGVVGSLLSVLDSSTPFRLSDSCGHKSSNVKLFVALTCQVCMEVKGHK